MGRYYINRPVTTTIPDYMVVMIPPGKTIKNVTMSSVGASAVGLVAIGSSDAQDEGGHMVIINCSFPDKGGRSMWNGSVYDPGEQYVKAWLRSTPTGGGWKLIVEAE